MKTLDELNGYDKAAIIFDILGDSLSINMFKDIPEAEFYKLRDHAKSLKNTVPTSVKKEVEVKKFPSQKHFTTTKVIL